MTVNLQEFMEGVISSSKVVYNLEIALDALITAEKYLNKDNAAYKNVRDGLVNTDLALRELTKIEV